MPVKYVKILKQGKWNVHYCVLNISVGTGDMVKNNYVLKHFSKVYQVFTLEMNKLNIK